MAFSNAIRVVDVRTAVCQISATIRIIVRRNSEARRGGAKAKCSRQATSAVVGCAEGVNGPLPPEWQRSTDHRSLTSTDRKAR